ncbi:MAG: hypothetical protein ACE5I7_09935 [Candidatus Binatia bacterium]
MTRGVEELPRGLAAIIAGLWVASALNVLYWIVFFTSGAVYLSSDPAYLTFERTFFAADVWLGTTCVLCAEGLRRQRSWAVLFGIAAGSAFVYLGLMDILYNLAHGTYRQLRGETLAEIGINLTCFTFGPLLMWYVWRHRRWLDTEEISTLRAEDEHHTV